MSDAADRRDEELMFTVATVWREERVSCPHADILKAHLAGALDPAASDYVAFHLDESQCPYCLAVVEDLRANEVDAAQADFEGIRSRLLRSTVTALRKAR